MRACSKTCAKNCESRGSKTENSNTMGSICSKRHCQSAAVGCSMPELLLVRFVTRYEIARKVPQVPTMARAGGPSPNGWSGTIRVSSTPSTTSVLYHGVVCQWLLARAQVTGGNSTQKDGIPTTCAASTSGGATQVPRMCDRNASVAVPRPDISSREPVTSIHHPAPTQLVQNVCF